MLRYLFPIFFLFFRLSFAGDNNMSLISPDFKNNGKIPVKFTCQGDNISPELKINGVSPKTKSLVLIVDDPDAPAGTWVHWVLYNIPPKTEIISENQRKGSVILNWGAYQGLNSWNKIGYGGPCPPSGTHRYFFKLYALKQNLSLKKGATKQELENEINKNLIQKAELIGLYKKI